MLASGFGIVGVAAAAVVVATVAVLVVARMSGQVRMALVAGGLVELLASVGGLRLVLRRSPRRGVVASVGALVLVAGSAAAVLVPLSDPAPARPSIPEEASWQLTDGSEIAYRYLPARGVHRPTPVLFLHGGPGIPDPTGAALFGGLTADGYDVYAYDQIGTGGSSRLPDPAAYGVDRDVSDLEQVRVRVGAAQLILIGHSYGAVLAAHYLAAHRTRVAGLVLLSPAALDPTDTSADRATAGLSTGARVEAYARALAPRALLGYLLLQVSPAAAHAYLPDAEADARNDAILTSAEPALHCQPDQAGARTSGSGFYRLQYPQSRSAPPGAEFPVTLAGLLTPVLIVKGSCDYVSWSSAVDYAAVLQNVTLVYLVGAGHNIHHDQPEVVLATTRAFLTDQPLPVTPQRDWGMPRDYQGPP